MKIDILTLFPSMFAGPFEESIVKRAQDKSLLKINIHNLRGWAIDKHKTVDDRSYGGGTGMILMIEPIYNALQDVRQNNSKIVLLDAAGKPFNQLKAQDLSHSEHLIFIAGRYEGVDERIKEHLVDEVISIGDYVLTGGELPTMVILDAVTRLIPGVLEKPEATQLESFSPLTELGSQPLLEYPQYTRPVEFMGWKVPDVLSSGDHKKIQQWRYEQALAKTRKIRPDLLKEN